MKSKRLKLFRWSGTLLGTLLLSVFMLLPRLASASTGSTLTTQQFFQQWGTHGTSPGQFDDITGIAYAPNGNLYIADNTNMRIMEYSTAGAYITEWGSSGSGNNNFTFPNGIAIASNGNVYVADTGNNRVLEFTSSGTYVTQWAVANADSVAIAANGNVYVTSTTTHAVYEFTSSGTAVTQFGTITNGAGGNGVFDDPGGIAIASNGNLYITDSRGTLGDQLVQELTSSGTFVTQWTVASGTPDPVGIALDSNGNVYVATMLANTIYEYSSSGTLKNTFGGTGSGNGTLQDPIALAFDSNNDFFVTDSGNSLVQEFYLPQNLAFLTQPGSSNVTNVTLPAGTNITADTETASSVKDGSYTYPLGLAGITFSTINRQAGASNQVQIVFQTSLQPNEVTPRMFNATTNTYSSIPGATVTSTTVNGQPALQLTYSITDGGALDEDGAANGVIVDPVGLAVTSAPNTGFGAPDQDSNLITAVLVFTALAVSGLGLLIINKENFTIH